MKTLKIGIVALALLTSIGLGTASLKVAKTKHASPADITCLAKNIYHEARGEPIEGQLAVAQVTLNRVASGKFQSSICSAVYAHKQFSWTISGRAKINDTKSWKAAVAVATAVLTRSIDLPHFNALYFHTKQVKPSWSRKRPVLAVIGSHVFYN